MCLSAALILLIWGFFHTVPVPESQGGGVRRSPSGLALIGAIILLISSTLRIQNESYHIFWFMVLPAAAWLSRRFFKETQASRTILTAVTILIAVAGIVLLNLPQNPGKKANSEIVRNAAANTLTAIENGNAEAIRQKYQDRSGFTSSSLELKYWSDAAGEAAAMPVNPNPPAADLEKVEAKAKLTVANSIFGYWISIISILIGTLVVVLSPYYMVLKMPISYRCRITFFIAITLMMFDMFVWSMYADNPQDYKKICQTLPDTMKEPGGTVRSAEILKYWLKHAPNNPGQLRRYLDGTLKLPVQNEVQAAAPQSKEQAEPKTAK